MTRIFICGLARDCANDAYENVQHLVRLAAENPALNISILIAENDSNDDTRQKIREAVDEHTENLVVETIFLDGIDEKYPVRVLRLAYLRELLLRRACAIAGDWALFVQDDVFYMPLDLDCDFARSITFESLSTAVLHLANGSVDAVFPYSQPVYYDIFALRARGWVESDVGSLFEHKNELPIVRLSKQWWYVARAQRRIRFWKRRRPIRVESAFGGYGLYRMASAARASYLAAARVQCEHVTFNRQIAVKEILTRLVVNAPPEHTTFRTSGWFGRAEIILRSLRKSVRQLCRRARQRIGARRLAFSRRQRLRP